MSRDQLSTLEFLVLYSKNLFKGRWSLLMGRDHLVLIVI